MPMDARAAAGALLALGALHSLSPGMGRLFAVALGLGIVLPSQGVRWGASGLLVGLGVWQMRGRSRRGSDPRLYGF